VSELCDGLNAGFRAPATSDDILGIACSQAERVLRFRVEGGIDDAFLDQVIGGPKGVSKKLALANVVYKEDAKRIFVETHRVDCWDVSQVRDMMGRPGHRDA
jgi:hypothetical protein